MLTTFASPMTLPADPPKAAADLDALRVLVVDDEPEIAELLSELLEAAGYAVVTAASGAQALRQLRASPFDAIVSDLHMPDLDGSALWREVAAIAPPLARRMLFVTGDTLGAGARKVLAETGCPSLDKPFRRADLLQRMRELLGPVR